MSLVQLLNPKVRYMSDDKSLLAVDALRDIYALTIHNIKLSGERQEHEFLTYPVTEFHVGNKMFIRNHVGDEWDTK